MTSLRRSALALTTAALAAVGLCAAAVPADAASPGHAKRVGTENFPDPGFAKFGSYYYLYKTGTGFGERTSASPASGYSRTATSMPTRPAWVSTSSPKLWAPHVFAVANYRGKPLYVMYFTGQSASRGVHCIGVATSRTPDRHFVPKAKAAVCASGTGYEAIDPSAYLAKDGKRYLLYKSDYGNAKGFDIRAIQMDTATGTATVGSSRSKIPSSTRMEAPSAISHGGYVWLFTSRGDYANCTYSTDVWRAKTFWNGTFTRVRTVMSSASTGLCGPGGATVLQDGSTTRIAFHAWKDGTASSKSRQAWVGVLKWNSTGQPYLY